MSEADDKRKLCQRVTAIARSLPILLVISTSLPLIAQSIPANSQSHRLGAIAKSGDTNADRGEAPPLDETLRWIKQTLESHGHSYQLANERVGQVITTTDDRLTGYEQCSVEFVKTTEYTNPRCQTSSTASFSFSDIDPESIQLRNFPPSSGDG
jgi:hypothetical protein